MAITYRDSHTNNGNNPTAGQFELPSSAAAGDLALCIYYQHAPTSSKSFTPPTLDGTGPTYDSSTYGYLWTGYKFLTSTEIARGYVANWSAGSSANTAAGEIVVVFSGVDTTTPLDGVTPVKAESSSATSINPAAITPASNNAAVLVIVCAVNDWSTTYTGSSGYTTDWPTADNSTDVDLSGWSQTGGNDGSCLVEWKILTGGGGSSEDPSAVSALQAADAIFAYTLVLKPGSSAQTATPTGVASGESIGTVTTLKGGVMREPTGVASGESIGTPTVAKNYNVSAVGVDSGESTWGAVERIDVGHERHQRVTLGTGKETTIYGEDAVSWAEAVFDPSSLGTYDGAGQEKIGHAIPGTAYGAYQFFLQASAPFTIASIGTALGITVEAHVSSQTGSGDLTLYGSNYNSGKSLDTSDFQYEDLLPLTVYSTRTIPDSLVNHDRVTIFEAGSSDPPEATDDVNYVWATTTYVNLWDPFHESQTPAPSSTRILEIYTDEGSYELVRADTIEVWYHATSDRWYTVTGIAGAEAIGTATTSLKNDIPVTGVASGEAIGTPTVIVDQTVTPTGVASGESIGTPQVNQTVIITARSQYFLTPSFEVDTDDNGWADNWSTNYGGTRPGTTEKDTVTSGVYHGTYAQEYKYTAVGGESTYEGIFQVPLVVAPGVTQGDQFYLSAYLSGTYSGTGNESIWLAVWAESSGGWKFCGSTSINASALTTTPTRRSVLVTVPDPAGATYTDNLIVTVGNIGSWTSGDVVTLRVDGALLEKSTTLGTYFDSSFPGAQTDSYGRAYLGGVRSGESIGTPTISKTYTVQPAGVDSGEAIGTPTVVLGNVTRIPDGVASGEAIGSVTVVPGGVVRSDVGGIASGEEIGTATALAGGVTREPVGVDSGEEIGTPIVVGEQVVTPDGVVSGESIGDPTIAKGGVTRAPDGVASGEAIGTATATASTSRQPVGVDSAEAIGTPDILKGGVSRTPDGVASGESLGSPTIVATYTATPEGVASGEEIGTPTVDQEELGQTAEPAGVASGEAIGTPDILKGGVTREPVGVDSGEEIGTATAFTGMTRSPDGVASGEEIGTPVVVKGGVTRIPVGVDSGEAIGTASRTATYTATPSGVDSGEAVGSVTIVLANTIIVVGVESAEAIGTPIVSIDQTVEPTGVDSGESIGTAVAYQGLMRAPDGVASGEEIGTPTVIAGPITIIVDGVASAESIGTVTVLPTNVVIVTGIPSGEEVGFGTAYQGTDTSIARVWKPAVRKGVPTVKRGSGGRILERTPAEFSMTTPNNLIADPNFETGFVGVDTDARWERFPNNYASGYGIRVYRDFEIVENGDLPDGAPAGLNGLHMKTRWQKNLVDVTDTDYCISNLYPDPYQRTFETDFTGWDPSWTLTYRDEGDGPTVDGYQTPHLKVTVPASSPATVWSDFIDVQIAQDCSWTYMYACLYWYGGSGTSKKITVRYYDETYTQVGVDRSGDLQGAGAVYGPTSTYAAKAQWPSGTRYIKFGLVFPSLGSSYNYYLYQPNVRRNGVPYTSVYAFTGTEDASPSVTDFLDTYAVCHYGNLTADGHYVDEAPQWVVGDGTIWYPKVRFWIYIKSDPSYTYKQDAYPYIYGTTGTMDYELYYDLAFKKTSYAEEDFVEPIARDEWVQVEIQPWLLADPADWGYIWWNLALIENAARIDTEGPSEYYVNWDFGVSSWGMMGEEIYLAGLQIDSSGETTEFGYGASEDWTWRGDENQSFSYSSWVYTVKIIGAIVRKAWGKVTRA